MVIIEGCDNTGKTTLINYLNDQFRTCRIIRSPGPKSAEFMAIWTLSMFQLQAQQPIIFDRFPVISETIYGPAIRGDNRLDLFEPGTFKFLLRAQKPLIIHCQPPLAHVLDLGDRDQMAGVRENLVGIFDAYDYLMRNLSKEGFDIITYDYTSQSIVKESLAGLIKIFFNRRGFQL